jgi:type 1 fimbria pilin
MKKLITLAAALCFLAAWGRAAEKNDTVTVKGEVIDLACYLDHGARGEKHAACAEKCIRSGLPVGLKTEDGKVYVLIGEHKPLNDQLAECAAKTVTIRGKAVSRDGINLLENAEIVQ